LRGELRLLGAMVTHERPGRVLVVGPVRTLVDVVLLAGLEVEVAGVLGIGEGMSGWILDVVDPLPVCEQAVRLVVIGLPEGAAVRRERETPDLHLVANHPRRDAQRRSYDECGGGPGPT